MPNPTAKAAWRTRIVAHRGGALHWPENSLTAVRGALEAGVDAIEIDVHLTSDDHVVVIHDPTLDRTTHGAGEVRHRLAKDLATIQVRGATEGVPLLSEVIDLILPTGVDLSIELKNDVGLTPYPRLVELLVDQIVEAGVLERTFVHAFDWTLIEQIAEICPDLETGCNVEDDTLQRFVSYEDLLDEILRLGARDINADHHLMDEARIELAQSRGLGVTLWTVNEDGDILRFLEAGVDHLCTDRPLRALELRREVEVGRALAALNPAQRTDPPSA